MNIAVVGPSPVPFAFGGIESLLACLREQITALTGHQVELIKLPSRERDFWELIDTYRHFWTLDLGHFDLVISTKYPAWMVQHPNHLCYMTHRLRGLYDTYHLTGLPTAVPGRVPAVQELCEFMERHARSSAEVLPEFFHRFERLRERRAEIPPAYFSLPGPFIRQIVHFLDDHALSPRQIRHFFATSRVVAGRKDYFQPGVRVQVIPHPSHLTGFRDVAMDYLFTTSRLDGPKRVDLIVRAMRLARTPRALRIAGTGPDEDRLRRLAEGDRRIQFLGFVRDRELVDLYAGALGVLFVPYAEDFGLITIEAMMSRKPVITCTDAGGPLDYVIDGETGFVAEPTPEDVARAIDLLADDVERARQMGARGHERASEITWERTVRTLLGQQADDRNALVVVGRPENARAPRLASVAPRSPRPKITVALPFPVFPPTGGGQLRTFSLYRHVARAFDVELVTVGEGGSPPFEAELAPGLTEIRVPRSRQHLEREAELARLAAGIPIGDIAFALLHEHTPEYAAALARSMEGAVLAVASHPYCLPVLRASLGRVPLAYEAQDVEYVLKQEVLAKAGPQCASLAETVRELEAEACRSACLILACSDEDRAELCRLYGVDAARIHIIANGVDTRAIRFTARDIREHQKAEFGIGGQAIALFVGSWHPPNLEAAEAVFEFARALPRVTFLLVGSQCLPLVDHPRPQNVALLGVVDEEMLATLLSLVDVALNPMRGGSGTNLKMATYLAAGVPVITTPLGARGYGLVDGEHALLCDLPAFPTRIAEVLEDRSLAVTLAARGRRLVEDRYDWGVIAAGLVSACRAVVGLPAHDHVVEALVDRVSTAIADLDVPAGHPLVAAATTAVIELEETARVGPNMVPNEPPATG